ncbi:hypothetical protein TanjilG_02665 [Lupinus angustifolius]|uniref:BZIP domain-containing protein n=1 Tax=Lupinus angustifolius TaxID=3871 RepID=A0A4P1RC35_LUPAN|nr:PREDICTED: bZIP transcription factor 53-like [Lupinus angustifolius]OIW07031.1 hypothetical protein TanjilG_02665 [Lupinus angustifolius]
MASIQRSAASSGSEGGDPASIDERKRKRMISNRESARRSRMKKQKVLEDLTEEVYRLQSSNKEINQSIKTKEDAYLKMESGNNILKAQTMELSDRLRSLNSIIEMAEEVNGNRNGNFNVFPIEMPQILDPFMNPWQLYYPFHPLMASPDMSLH